MKKTDYKIIIPSYRRHDILKMYTLNALSKTDVNAEIYVFVADDEDLKAYSQEFEGTDIKVVKGVRGIPNQRNFIQKYFPVGEKLVFMDDDLEKIIGLDGSGKRVDATHLDYFIKEAFKITESCKLKMWGINSTNNILEMGHRVSVGLIYLVGNFYGLINTHDIFVDEGTVISKRRTYEAGKESHERSLKMYKKYGGVLKFRSFGVVSRYWGVKGGHQVSRNQSGELEASLVLHRMFPDITELRTYKGHPDLVIKSKTKVFKAEFIQGQSK